MAIKTRVTKSNGMTEKDRYSKYGMIFVAPFIIGFLLFLFYPLVYTIWLSFTDKTLYSPEASFVGFKNYIDLLQNDIFITSMKNTFILWSFNFIPQILLAMFLAAMFTNRRLKVGGQGFFKTIFYMPNIITAATVAILFRKLFSINGPVDQILMMLHLTDDPVRFYESTGWTRGIISFIQFWMWYGNTMLILAAGMLAISDEIYESASMDGASNKHAFFKITLPLIKPITIYVLITSIIGGLQMFDIPYMLAVSGNNSIATAQDAKTVAIFIYEQGFTGGYNYYMAATASVVLLLIAAALSFVVIKGLKMGGNDK